MLVGDSKCKPLLLLAYQSNWHYYLSRILESASSNNSMEYLGELRNHYKKYSP